MFEGGIWCIGENCVVHLGILDVFSGMLNFICFADAGRASSCVEFSGVLFRIANFFWFARSRENTSIIVAGGSA